MKINSSRINKHEYNISIMIEKVGINFELIDKDMHEIGMSFIVSSFVIHEITSFQIMYW